MSAVISDCGKYRYRLERDVAMSCAFCGSPASPSARCHTCETIHPAAGPVYAFFGVNPSTADATIDDATVRKWRGFVKTWGGSRFIVGNVFAFRATDVRKLRREMLPVGPENFTHLERIAGDANVLVPCWGNRAKVPPSLHHHIDKTLAFLRTLGKPMLSFGLTVSRDPKHPLMLSYDTEMIEFDAA